MTNKGTPPVNLPDTTLFALDSQTNTSPENPSETTLGLNSQPTTNPFLELILKALDLRNHFNDPQNVFWFIDQEVASTGLSEDDIKKLMCSLKVALPGVGKVKPEFIKIKNLKVVKCKDTTKHPHN